MLLAAGALLLVAPLALQPTSAPLVPRSVRRTCLAATAGTLDVTAEALDRRAFLAAHAGDAAKAEAAHLSKAEWVRENGATCGVDIAPFLRSNSFLAALEGCVDRSGTPIILARGVPYGGKDAVAKQVQYAYERCLVQCAALGHDEPTALTIVDVRAPSFRFPDGACIRTIRLMQRHYPWALTSSCRSIFVSCPSPVQWCFKKLKPLMSEAQYSSIIFAEPDQLTEHVSPSNLPPELGGTSTWSAAAYIAERCSEEGVADAGATASYDGCVRSIDERPQHARPPAPSHPGARWPCVAGMSSTGSRLMIMTPGASARARRGERSARSARRRSAGRSCRSRPWRSSPCQPTRVTLTRVRSRSCNCQAAGRMPPQRGWWCRRRGGRCDRASDRACAACCPFDANKGSGSCKLTPPRRSRGQQYIVWPRTHVQPCNWLGS